MEKFKKRVLDDFDEHFEHLPDKDKEALKQFIGVNIQSIMDYIHKHYMIVGLFGPGHPKTHI